jgi:GTP cyclohydrolase II
MVGAMADLMQEDGELSSVEAARDFGKEHSIPFITAEQIAEYRRKHEGVSIPLADEAKPTMDAESNMWIDEIEADCIIKFYGTSTPPVEIVALVKGDVKGREGVPARVHSECFTGDIIGSKRCDCGQQLHNFLRIMNEESCGVLLYIRGHEGRGIGLANKIKAYHLQDKGIDTVDANLQLGLPVDTRTYNDSLFVFQDLGVASIRLFTNNPLKMGALKPIVKDVTALASVENERNSHYLRTKRERLNHRTVLETFKLPPPNIDAPKTLIGVVYTTWNEYYVKELVAAAESELDRAGVRKVKMAVPGANELVSGARAIVRQAKPNAVVVLGVLIRGSSDIYDATCNAVMTGITELNANQDVPIVTGVLMCANEGQAHERSHGSNNPAKAWAETALHMASLSSQSPS